MTQAPEWPPRRAPVQVTVMVVDVEVAASDPHAARSNAINGAAIQPSDRP